MPSYPLHCVKLTSVISGNNAGKRSAQGSGDGGGGEQNQKRTKKVPIALQFLSEMDDGIEERLPVSDPNANLLSAVTRRSRYLAVKDLYVRLALRLRYGLRRYVVRTYSVRTVRLPMNAT